MVDNHFKIGSLPPTLCPAGSCSACGSEFVKRCKCPNTEIRQQYTQHYTAAHTAHTFIPLYKLTSVTVDNGIGMRMGNCRHTLLKVCEAIHHIQQIVCEGDRSVKHEPRSSVLVSWCNCDGRFIATLAGGGAVIYKRRKMKCPLRLPADSRPRRLSWHQG